MTRCAFELVPIVPLPLPRPLALLRAQIQSDAYPFRASGKPEGCSIELVQDQTPGSKNFSQRDVRGPGISLQSPSHSVSTLSPTNHVPLLTLDNSLALLRPLSALGPWTFRCLKRPPPPSPLPFPLNTDGTNGSCLSLPPQIASQVPRCNLPEGPVEETRLTPVKAIGTTLPAHGSPFACLFSSGTAHT